MVYVLLTLAFLLFKKRPFREVDTGLEEDQNDGPNFPTGPFRTAKEQLVNIAIYHISYYMVSVIRSLILHEMARWKLSICCLSNYFMSEINCLQVTKIMV